MVESGEEYEIEKIINKRVSRNKVQYLVKWKGYSDFDSQWLDIQQLDNAREAIMDFEADLSR